MSRFSKRLVMYELSKDRLFSLILLISMILIALSIANSSSIFYPGNNKFYVSNISKARVYKAFVVDCSSDSMDYGCNDIILCKTINKSSEMTIGKVYVYSKGNKKIIHRLIGVVDSKLIFKGDNNDIIDKPVDVSSVVCEFVGRIDGKEKKNVHFLVD